MSKTTKPAKEEAPQEMKWGPGPGTVSKVQEKLRTIIAFAFLGKRAYMEGDYDLKGWNKYFQEIGGPDGQFGDLDGLAEMAFDGLLKMACEAWQELFEPTDAIEGPVIQRVPAEELGGKQPE